MPYLPWSEAVRRALYGPAGFYRRPEGPAGHFRTSVHTSGAFAAALLQLAHRHGLRRVVDVGAGRGELLAQLHALDPAVGLLGVDVVARPAGLAPAVGWARELPARLEQSLVVANEWLDVVPFELVRRRADGDWELLGVDPRTLQVQGLGPPGPEDARWLSRWWSGARPPADAHVGELAEVGRLRDEAWAALVARLRESVAVAVDYAHTREERAGGLWAAGSVAGWRDGRAVSPVLLDGSTDVTAHVALDACAAAGVAAGAVTTQLTSQRHALRALGVRPTAPDQQLAVTDPVAYIRGLDAAGRIRELLDPQGLGGFGWLEQSRGV